MIVEVGVDGSGLDAGYLARRAMVATKSLSLRHISVAVCSQLVWDGKFAPSGRGQSRTGDFQSRLVYADRFCDLCRAEGIDTDAPSERVRDVICHVGPGRDGRSDSIVFLAKLQDSIRNWALDGGHTIAFGLHALESTSTGQGLRYAHLHMVAIDCADDLEAQVVSVASSFSGVMFAQQGIDGII
jgi:hypothetical protein